MDIELLKTFLEVRRTRHFRRAAENLYLTQAAVSARIKLLENQFGTPLFTRYRNNIQLTGAGERLISYAETILTSWEQAQTDLALNKKQPQLLSLGATNGLWELLLQDALNEMHRTMPEIALRAESHGQDVLIRRLMERTLDISLLSVPAKLAEIKSVTVAQSKLVLVSTTQGQSINHAINNAYVAIDWGTDFEISFSQFFHNPPQPVLQTTLAQIALRFILSHGGSAYLPLPILNDNVDKLFQVEGAPIFNRPIFACYHQESKNYKLIKKFMSLIKTLNISDDLPNH